MEVGEAPVPTIVRMAIPTTFIQELLARADVVEIVGRYVPLKKSGANFMGLCPFHGEKSPSFSVSPSKQFYHCFGCGKSGNAIGFLMEHAGMGFVEAVTDLAQQYGMQVPEDDATPRDRELAQQHREKQHTLSTVLEKAAEGYRKCLKDSEAAIAYLKQRGLSGEIARQFGLGYAPEGWRTLAGIFPKYDDPLLVESGLVILHEAEDGGDEKRYDRFRDRVMFPIRNVKGECIGFGGRVLGEGTPKYLNSPETPVFSKGRELYGLFEARTALREQGYALVTEGYMDVVALAQLGFPNAVATLGTACTPDHVQKLFRFTDAVVFSFDGDAAGRRAARKALDAALPLATDMRTIKFLFLPEEHDPDSFIRANGAEAFARYVSEATPLSRFMVEVAREGCDLNAAEGRSRLTGNAKPLWNLLPDGALKMQQLVEFSNLTQLTTRELAGLWGAPSGGSRSTPRNVSGFRPPSAGSGRRRAKPTNRSDHAARILLTHSHLWSQLTSNDHDVLASLAAPHGDLFVWMEGQWHEHGPQPWAELSLALQGHQAQALALKLMSENIPGMEAEGIAHELRDVLNRMQIEHIKVLETSAIAESKSDPAAFQRYRELQARRAQLEKTQSEGIIQT